ncbi:hypothetical protein A2755_03925 [Candidatus Wolfebacteria bacterium RIFCSPHIGHO2_01_FULL_48_22]|uniref:Uncharacterized protein n=2 Tax=Candidatus Wolfeibacteriota TaxID=1752735 RepID=A0A1F8DNW8_9BACT|nr:MAG: hypothetical protein A2755_03925 [Candidatus Wolfebacteria bacterium RIFCSPHIGHO2_01_FULL_48_22]OGM93486.1 MAG: hypothetical protein A2935_01275 [Candidatus Wolfebacteria bacterium RIFCSPLOWO2_01_FULL_47_17b]
MFEKLNLFKKNKREDNLGKYYKEEFPEGKPKTEEDPYVKTIINELGGEEIFDEDISPEEKGVRIKEVERYKKERN